MSNYDEKTGIAYGVISPHAISADVLNEIYDQGTDPVYEYQKEEFTGALHATLEQYGFSAGQIDEVLTPAIDAWNEQEHGSDNGECDYSDNEYTLHVSGDNFGIFVIKSPYYTYCRKCSPCAPGAGDLNNPVIENDDIADAMSFKKIYSIGKAYCLDKSFFDDEYAKIPYRVFRVDNDEEVI